MQIKTLRLQRFCDLPKVTVKIKLRSLDLFQGLLVLKLLCLGAWKKLSELKGVLHKEDKRGRGSQGQFLLLWWLVAKQFFSLEERDESSDIHLLTHQAPLRIPIHQLANGHILTSAISTKQVLATKYAATNDIQLF